MAPSTAVLLLQLGTPDDASVPAVRRYLRQFLGDRRIVETNRFLWWFILNGIILRTRPRSSAAKYRRIWNPQTGMPLLYHTRRQAAKLQAVLGEELPVHFAMNYGNPSIASVVRRLAEQKVERVVALPMYPQYSATTTGSSMDGLFRAMMALRFMPAVRIVKPYYEHPAYIEAMALLIESELAKLSRPPEHILLSFHGIPTRYTQKGDPYALHVERTTQALVKRLGWPRGTWSRTYQSLFGREEWLKPFTETTLAALAKRGVRRVFVANPGFTADCLETIDEIGREAKEVFLGAGGETLNRCPCLNDIDPWIDAMAAIVREEAGAAC